MRPPVPSQLVHAARVRVQQRGAHPHARVHRGSAYGGRLLGGGGRDRPEAGVQQQQPIGGEGRA
eukprot:4589378-Pyramimonas_sp.AAC.1